MRKYSLTELLDGEIAVDEKQTVRFTGVQIPMIQRDYAQGRNSQASVRNRFLTALFRALNENCGLALDFVYGSVQRLDNEPFFVPLDGQQRLTTLFLLHWYIGSCELAGQDKVMLQNKLSRFSYATRRTARDFCAKLASQEIGVGQRPSTVICKQSWFYRSYQQDPTVQAMLKMLDAIQLKYSEKSTPELYPQLSKLTFYVLPLDGFGLSDELYIKMNARGKPLTGFENFKADLISWLRRESNPHQQVLATEVGYAGRQFRFLDAFCIKLDAEWMDLFWKLGRKPQAADTAYMRFWHRFLMAMHFVNSDPVAKEYGTIPLVDSGELNPPYSDFAVYEALLAKPGVIQLVDRFLDKLAKHYQVVRAVISDIQGSVKGWHPLDTTINRQQRILFLAVLYYLLNEDFHEQALRRWLRVVWNISMDPGLQSPETMVIMMQVIEKLAKGSSGIHDFLQLAELDALIAGAGFVKTQLAEERLKAGLILTDAAWEAVLIRSEHHPLFQGNVGFLLSGRPSLAQFQHRVGLAEEVFSGKGAHSYFADDHRLLRAAICRFRNRKTLVNATMRDDAETWRSWLRRNADVKDLVVKLLDLNDLPAVATHVDELVTQSSALVADDSVEYWQHIHQQLYGQTKLQQWMQKTKAVNLKWFADRIFICRSGSWYDWVAIDTYSNSIATALCDRLDFTSDHRIPGTNYFTGRHGVTLQRHTAPVLLAHYNNAGEISIMIRQLGPEGLNGDVPDKSSVPRWELWKKYPQACAMSKEAAEHVAEEICRDVNTLISEYYRNSPFTSQH